MYVIEKKDYCRDILRLIKQLLRTIRLLILSLSRSIRDGLFYYIGFKIFYFITQIPTTVYSLPGHEEFNRLKGSLQPRSRILLRRNEAALIEERFFQYLFFRFSLSLSLSLDRSIDTVISIEYGCSIPC